MKTSYTISVAHHSRYIPGRGKYHLMLLRADTGQSAGSARELCSDSDLRDVLANLGYRSEEIDSILDTVADKGTFWKEIRQFDNSTVAALGF